jgi:exodeoxyribonuclease VIII
MTFAEYEKLARVNWSTLKAMSKSPAHYRHGLLQRREDTAAMRLGRCVHLAVLEPELFASRVERWPEENGRRYGKKWDKFRADHEGCEILTEDEHDLCLAIQRAVRSDREAARLLVGGESEVTAQWTDEATGLDCKARLDKVNANIVDLKTTRDASPTAFGRESWRLQYHCQMGFYQGGLAHQLGGTLLPVYVIAVEKDAPHAVQVYHLTDDLLDTGREEVGQLLARLSFCRANDVWPGYAENGEILELMPPSWALESDEDADALELVASNA